MNILIVAATQLELQTLKQSMAQNKMPHQITFLTTDVGMMAASFHLTQHLLQQQYDIVIQIGIAGAFYKNLAIGDVVEVVADTYGDTGAEDHEDFIPITKMQLIQQDQYLFKQSPFIYNAHYYTDLPQTKGITVNSCTGSERTLLQRKKYFDAGVESMEGIALHYVCTQLKQPYIQLRAISNYVDKRDTNTWNIPKALENLNTFVIRLLQQPIVAKPL